ncbi:MAG: recombinase family protein [Phycisphaerales bacterium]|nr:recombinase family protein [Phycisphaerales bacterium]
MKSKVVTRIRCAVYCRKSSEAGLEQEFNSLDAQRDAGEAYIASQKAEGWVCLPDRYEDGGYTGGNMERPGLKRLMADINADKVDCVVVYKIDRLSRSLLDFARMMETFERHKVAFVSVTQQFNTGQSMGRLMLNVLLSFAQFERELCSERTRDKIAAAKRRGKWVGGRPILGYDVLGGKLTVNEAEAQQVREIFGLYLKSGSLNRMVEDLNRRGWKTKGWTRKDGTPVGAQTFHKSYLHRLLTNVAYIGRVRDGVQTHAGEHKGIVAQDMFAEAQAMLAENGRAGPSEVRNKHGAVLKGLLRCRACDKPMTHVFTNGPNGRVYRYYTCYTAQTGGACPSRSVPAQPIEDFVVSRIRTIGGDAEIAALVIDHLRAKSDAERTELRDQLAAAEREAAWLVSEITRASTAPGEGGVGRDVAELRDQLAEVEGRAAGLHRREADIGSMDATVTAKGLRSFDPLWRMLSTAERAKLLRLIIISVEYHGGDGDVTIGFHPESAWIATAPANAEEIGV